MASELTEEDVQAAIEDGAQKIKARIGIITAWLRGEYSAARIERAIRAGEVPQLLADINSDLERAARALSAEVNEVYIESGKDAAAVVEDFTGKVMHWSPTESTAAARMQANEIRIVGDYTAEQMGSIRDVLVNQVAHGLNPRAGGVAIEDTIGLAPMHQEWVTSYRRLLEQGDAESLTAAAERELHAGRYDKTIANAIKREARIDQATIDRMVEAYRLNAIAYRAEVIARSEGLRAVHEGHDDALRAAVAGGDLGDGQVIGIWHVTVDGRERTSHREMQGQERELGEPFESGDGNLLLYPGDPAAPLKETCQCRCCRGFRLIEGRQQAA